MILATGARIGVYDTADVERQVDFLFPSANNTGAIGRRSDGTPQRYTNIVGTAIRSEAPLPAAILLTEVIDAPVDEKKAIFLNLGGGGGGLFLFSDSEVVVQPILSFTRTGMTLDTTQLNSNAVFVSDNNFDIGAVGANRPRDIHVARNVLIGGDRGIQLAGQTDGAGAAAGTLGNAPAATDPDFWIPCVVNGTNRLIPSWNG